ncbi:MAG: thiamine pyrophosphate-requiring protein [Chloroflexi bacterium]|nr:thiamine pyrophosphate-requiring protein [Chloroflexota bacterium]
MTTGSDRQSQMLRTIQVEDAAEAFVEMLNSNDVDYLFLNSGTDTFPIQEAMVRMREQERHTPDVVLCIDEITGMFAAQGYYQLKGRPQAVLVHVDAGTAQIGGAYHDVQRDRSGVVVFAGRAPSTIGRSVPGAKDLTIHWIQEQRDQNGIVRTFTKWDYELRHVESLNWAMQKAFQVAATEPAGPVYMTLPRELIMQKMERLLLPPADRHGKPVPPSADPAAIARVADWLVSAQRPLIIAGSPGRHTEAVASLVQIAELAGAPVAGAITNRLNIPSHHPLNAATCGAPSIADADFILVVDHDVPWVPDNQTLEPAGKVAWIDIDPSKDDIPLWSFPADLLIHAASQSALPQLVAALQDRLTASDRKRIGLRIEKYRANSAARRKEIEAAVAASATLKPLGPLWIGSCLEQVLTPDSIVMNEAMSGSEPWTSVANRSQPGTVFASGGSSLGWALGAALGAKLAEPDRDVVALQGDGSFVYSRPTSAFWAAEKYSAPFLTVIYNNSRHRATVRNWDRHYPEGVGKKTGRYIGVDIDPSPDYDVLAKACRGYGERVEDPDEVLPALKRGLARVRDGQAAVLDMRIER